MWTMLRTNADIRSLFVAQVVSYAGDWFAYVAFVGLVQDHTDAPVLVTMVYVTQALPAFLMSPVTGPTADRRDRRRVIQTASVLQSVAAAGLLLTDSSGTLWLGYVCLGVISALGAFVPPAAQAGLPNLARDATELRQASILFGSLWGSMLAVGAALGGLVASWHSGRSSPPGGPSLSRLLLMCGCSGLAFGAFYLGLSVAPALAVAVPLVLLAHLGGGAQWTLSTYGLQRRAPDEILGRILAGDYGMVTLIITVSNATAGGLAGLVGPRWAIAAFAALGLVTATSYLALTRSVRAGLDAEESVMVG